MKINKEKLYKLTSICLLIISIIVTFVFIKDHIYKWLNSDDASELILGKLLASENSLISKNWYYSTELRVLNTNIFYALIFKFTDNFYVVRMVSYILMWIMLLLVYFGLCKALNIKKNMIISASLLFVPFSLDYYKFVLSTAYYIPHIVISFLTIMLSELYLKSNKKRYLIIGIILSIFAGLGGPRQLIVIYIPLFVASVVPILFKKDDDYNFLRYGLFVLIGSAIGYVLNTTILARIYHFETYGHLSFVDFSIDRFNSLIKGMFNCFGYTKGRVFSGSLITNITCAAWLFLNIYTISYSLKHKDEIKRDGGGVYRLSITTMWSYLIFIALYLFTNMGLVDRYYLPITVLSIPLTALFMEEVGFDVLFIKKSVVYLLFILAVFGSGYGTLHAQKDYDCTSELNKITDALEEGEYLNGYGTFWNGNVLTELSNGKIDAYVWREKNIPSSQEKIDDLYHWLQFVSHDYIKPSGKVFMLLKGSEKDLVSWANNLSKASILYQSDECVVYGFDSYEEMKAVLS